MNFYETRMGNIFFNSQMPRLIKALEEIASALRKPAPAIKLDKDSMADPDFLHDLFYGLYEPDVFGNRVQPSPLDRDVMRAEADLLSVPGQSRELFGQYQEAVSRRNDAEMERAFSSGYRAAFHMLISGIREPSAPVSGGVQDGQ